MSKGRRSVQYQRRFATSERIIAPAVTVARRSPGRPVAGFFGYVWQTAATGGAFVRPLARRTCAVFAPCCVAAAERDSAPKDGVAQRGKATRWDAMQSVAFHAPDTDRQRNETKRDAVGVGVGVGGVGESRFGAVFGSTPRVGIVSVGVGVVVGFRTTRIDTA